MMQKLKIRTQIMLGNSLILAVMVAVGVVLYFSVNNLIDSSKWVEHTHEVMQNGETMAGKIVNMETGMRGFLIGGTEEFLDPFKEGKKSFAKILAATKELVNDNPAQVERLEQIEILANQWREKAGDTQIALRRKANEGREVDLQFKKIRASTIGKEIFDGIRVKIAAIDKKFADANLIEGRHLTLTVLLDLINMETGQRGFLLTGEEASLDPYNQGSRALIQGMEEMRGFASRNPGARVGSEEIGHLQKDVQEWMDKAANPEIAARRAVNKVEVTLDDVAALVGKKEGKQTMDDLRAAMAEFVSIEANLLAGRSKEATETADTAIAVIIFGILAAVLLGIGIVVYLILNVRRQLGGEPAEVSQIAEEIAGGNLAIEFDQARKNLGLYGNMADMVDNLRQIVGEVLDCSNNLSQSSTDLSGLAAQNSSSAEQSSAQSRNVAATTEQVSTNVSTVAAAVEEMTTTIKEVAQTVAQSAEVTRKAVESSADAERLIAKLGESSAEVGQVTEVISKIAEQTNILALNASIEAASAGDAGKGFSVVANEVKELAKETAKATENIAKRIADIQNDATVAVKAINDINGVMTEVDSLSTSISTSVEEQSVTSNEISRNMAEAAKGVNDIASNISNLEKTASTSVEQMGKTKTRADDLGKLSNRLSVAIGGFRIDSNDGRRDMRRLIGDQSEPQRLLDMEGEHGYDSSGRIGQSTSAGNGELPQSV